MRPLALLAALVPRRPVELDRLEGPRHGVELDRGVAHQAACLVLAQADPVRVDVHIRRRERLTEPVDDGNVSELRRRISRHYLSPAIPVSIAAKRTPPLLNRRAPTARHG